MKPIVIGLLLVCLVCRVPLGWCSEPDEGWKSVSVMEGISATSRSEYFHAYEVLVTYGLPWSLRGESGWGAALQLNASAGALHAAGETGVIGTIGPSVVLDKGGKGIAFELGGDVNILSKYKFGRVDLNGNPLFDGHIGVAYRFVSGPGIFYRFLHMSNGGQGRQGEGNTGLDLHMFGASWNL